MALFQQTKPPLAEEAPEGEATPSFGPRSAGDMLRQRREALGLELGDVAAALRIKPAYLAALEAGRPDQLPGATYASGFMRAYADYLGLDGREILLRFKRESPVLDAKPDLSFPMPLGERSIPGGAMLFVALILALCGYGTWYYLSTGERSRPERVTEVPASLLPPQSERRPIESAGSRPAEALAAPRVSAPAAGAPAAREGANPELGPSGAPAPAAGVLPPLPALALPAAAPALPPSAAPTAPPPPSQTEERRASAVAESAARIVIRATADSWVQIRDASQSVLLTRVLKAGESYHVPDWAGVSMRTGNAGGLEITVDGNPAPSIGRIGAIRRHVALDPQALVAGTAIRD